MIFEESPVGLKGPRELSASEVLSYQQLAEQTVFGEFDVWCERLR